MTNIGIQDYGQKIVDLEDDMKFYKVSGNSMEMAMMRSRLRELKAKQKALYFTDDEAAEQFPV